MRRTWPVSYAAIQRVCVWVIKESDCHIRRPTREGCGLCPSLLLCTRTSSSLPPWLASPGPRHSLLFPTASRTRFRGLFMLLALSGSANSLAPSDSGFRRPLLLKKFKTGSEDNCKFLILIEETLKVVCSVVDSQRVNWQLQSRCL